MSITTLDIPLVIDPETVALVFDRATGALYDECRNLDTAVNYALYESDAYAILAVNPVLWYDGTVRLTTAELQATLDREAGLRADCYGEA